MTAKGKVEKLHGGTLRRKQHPHRCGPPAIAGHDIAIGDEWDCGTCGSTWQVEASCDPRPGENEPYWKCTFRREPRDGTS